MRLIEIEGVPCVSRHQFAEAVNISVSAVDKLIAKGNRIRKLRAIKLPWGKGVVVYIPKSEITEYVFASRGFSHIYYMYRRRKGHPGYERYQVKPIITEFVPV